MARIAGSKVTIWYDPKLDGYHLQCVFSEAFINFIKASIPASDRSYESSSRTCTFAKKYLDAVRLSAEKFFGPGSVSVITEQQVRGAAAVTASKAQTIDQALAEFMHILPFEAAQAAFRRASIVLHPDHGGDMEKMSRLNTLWDRIEKEIYKP